MTQIRKQCPIQWANMSKISNMTVSLPRPLFPVKGGGTSEFSAACLDDGFFFSRSQNELISFGRSPVTWSSCRVNYQSTEIYRQGRAPTGGNRGKPCSYHQEGEQFHGSGAPLQEVDAPLHRVFSSAHQPRKSFGTQHCTGPRVQRLHLQHFSTCTDLILTSYSPCKHEHLEWALVECFLGNGVEKWSQLGSWSASFLTGKLGIQQWRRRVRWCWRWPLVHKDAFFSNNEGIFVTTCTKIRTLQDYIVFIR